MPVIFRLTCSTADCPHAIDGEEELNLRDAGACRHIGGLSYEDCVVANGRGIEHDLYAAAVASGWHWDGSRWFCGPCANPGTITELADLWAELAAHSANV